MIAPVDVFFGHDKLEAKFKMSSFDADVIALTAIQNQLKPFTFRGSLSSESGRIPVRARILGTLSEGDFGAWKMGDKVDNDYTIAITKYTLTHGEKELIHVDPIGCILRVNGEDQYAEDRVNLGF